ncbi:MAG: CBS domain-containing protein [Ekhidna sp.]|nr:CBS domain-containing protein [Ekhidna sp.]
MSNLITDRVAYFLKGVPPFSDLSGPELNTVTEKITVKYLEADEVLFSEGEEQKGFCFVLNKGDIKLSKKDQSGGFLVDQCEPGDVFGVRSIITGNDYSMTATSTSESLVYMIPKDYFLELFESNNTFSNYFASGYAAGQIIVRKDQESIVALPSQPRNESITYSKEVVKCNGSETVQEASIKMSTNAVGSIVIADEKNLPIGIVTDTDLRNKVVSKGLDISVPIEKIMNKPVKTIAPDQTLTEVLMEMIRAGVHHLVVTKDGTDSSEIAGIVSDHDVVLAQLNHPASLIKAIKRSEDVAEWKRIRQKAEDLLKDYLEQGISISLITNLITKINDTIIEKAINKALEEVPDARKISFCWLNLGSEGREEQLLRTDQDNAILFADQPENEDAQKIMLDLGHRVNEMLTQCGFEECPANIMARNPMYCQPLSAWKKYFYDWIATPEPKSVMKATIFFDFRVGYGNEELAEELASYLVAQIQEHEMFLKFLAQNALQNPPPLSFFNNFLVERSGEHRNEFDIKKRGMMPLADAARLLSLDHFDMNEQNTIARFERLAELEENNRQLYEAAGVAYGILIQHRTQNGLRDGDSGRFIDLKGLNKLEKQILKNTFLSIKEIQDLVKVRFQQAYFQ